MSDSRKFNNRDDLHHDNDQIYASLGSVMFWILTLVLLRYTLFFAFKIVFKIAKVMIYPLLFLTLAHTLLFSNNTSWTNVLKNTAKNGLLIMIKITETVVDTLHSAVEQIE